MFSNFLEKDEIFLPDLLVQVEFEEASICWLEQMSTNVEQVLFQKARPCACTFLFSGVDGE